MLLVRSLIENDFGNKYFKSINTGILQNENIWKKFGTIDQHTKRTSEVGRQELTKAEARNIISRSRCSKTYQYGAISNKRASGSVIGNG